MAKRHNERDDAQDDPTSENESQADHTSERDTPTARKEDRTDAKAQDNADGDAEVAGNGDHTADSEGSAGTQPTVTRRSFAKAIGAAATLGGGASLLGNAAAASLDTYLEPDGDVTIPAGEYSWSGSGLSVGSSDSLTGEGNPGDVVWNLDSGTMDGNVEGHLENVVVRGANNDAKSGINLFPGASVDGFVWPEGGQQDEDRAFYTPDGGNDRLTVKNSAWGWMVNNGAYLDKPPVTMENCAAVNNNIANVRIGHRDGTSTSETTYVRNSLIAVTDEVENDATNVPHARGLRLRHPANLVIENCWFVYLDVSGTADLIELHDGAAGSTVTIKDCAFYNDSNGDLVRDKSGGEMDVTIENCTVAGSGSRVVEPEFSGSGFTEDDSVDFPLPSEVTGYPAADEINGIGPDVGPFDGSSSSTSNDNTLALHASPDNSTSADVSFTVTGDIEFAAEAESGTDTIVANDDGTTTATSVALSPDELDSYRFTGDVVGYSVPDGIVVDVSVNGTTTSFDELVGDTSTEDDVLEVIARQSGELNYEFDVDGSAELYETSEKVTAGNGDSITDNGDGTVTVTGFTGNDGYGDAYLVSGAVTSFTWNPEDYDFDVVVNDQTVAPADIESAQETVTDDGSTDDGSTDDSTTDDSTTDDTTTDDTTTDDTTTDDSTTDDTTDDTTTDDSTTDDTTTDDSTTDDTTTDDTTTDDTTDDTSDDVSSPIVPGYGRSGDIDAPSQNPHSMTIDGSDAYHVTTYTFTVSGDVVRDETLSAGGQNGVNWETSENFDSDGKVIGVVGDGTDVFRFDGDVEEITISGDAEVALDWDA